MVSMFVIRWRRMCIVCRKASMPCSATASWHYLNYIRLADVDSGVDSPVDSRVSFSRGNGIHGWRNHCIIVGECLHLGFLIHSEACYDLLITRIRMQFVRHHAVVVKISRSPDFLEVA